MARIDPIDPQEYYRPGGDILPKTFAALNALIHAHNTAQEPEPEKARILPSAKSLDKIWDATLEETEGSGSAGYLVAVANVQVATIEAVCAWLQGEFCKSLISIDDVCGILRADAQARLREAQK